MGEDERARFRRAVAGPARWQLPEVDAAALGLARLVRRAVAILHTQSAGREAARSRWVALLEPELELLLDGDLAAVEQSARRVRAAFGVGESVAEELPTDEARALRDAADETLRAIARFEARRRGGGRAS